ncbi:hypothetical protein P5G65_33430 [Paenibacillus chondroitinus]|uniref:Uncharacterized protein n=1 Tax=Paenibacillus chondroitinus TaxID=59842 RepID=A0ABU6DPT2_9BACL|nr:MULTISPECIES: hypothetical protein [Paenibacillus]MCY9657016.1 hypothetical protein [Paenibacillus anseongense]MEB4798812.1 hypothetical protein [Paenibacillus chondroitinus]
MEKGDVTVILLILIVGIGFLFFRFQRWLNGPTKKRIRIPKHSEIPQDEVVELLEGAGFDVLAGKTKIPISMTLNDKEQLESRLFIDYFVQKDDRIFLVKVAKERKPLEMTGSSIRDMLLAYSLIYPEADGVLYVDMAMNKIKKITFHIEV